MCNYKFSERAYAKLIFHAAKYPHLAVNGILLAEKNTATTKSTIQIVDAIPLFHQCLYVTPMAEIALMQIDAYAEREGLIIVGYYAAAENFYDNTIDKAPGARIADKIYEYYKNACFVLIDNKLVTLIHDRPAIKVFNCSADATGASILSPPVSTTMAPRWVKANYSLIQSEATLEAVSALLKRGAMRNIIDFDNHLDNPVNDWTNKFLNKDLKQIMAMY